ncbi:NAD-binding protein [Microbacterium sp. Se63.02b]|uniref:NAD-binding protein n=1 Tax=Microbacterium sp. Se63.02b TaxID=2709304 RepID=UPI00237B7252|nr:NAD-binding protein [Microbacterium sp. Se63.02b]
MSTPRCPAASPRPCRASWRSWSGDDGGRRAGDAAPRRAGASILHVGPAGAGDAAKALNNLVSASNIAVASEALSIAERFGIDPETMTAVLNEATGRSQATELKFPRYILTGSFDSGFAYDLMLKDMTIAMGIADGLETPVVDTVFETLRGSRGRLGDAPDHTEIGRLYGLGTTPHDPTEKETSK